MSDNRPDKIAAGIARDAASVGAYYVTLAAAFALSPHMQSPGHDEFVTTAVRVLAFLNVAVFVRVGWRWLIVPFALIPIPAPVGSAPLETYTLVMLIFHIRWSGVGPGILFWLVLLLASRILQPYPTCLAGYDIVVNNMLALAAVGAMVLARRCLHLPPGKATAL